jgi:hypothetical protein
MALDKRPHARERSYTELLASVTPAESARINTKLQNELPGRKRRLHELPFAHSQAGILKFFDTFQDRRNGNGGSKKNHAESTEDREKRFDRYLQKIFTLDGAVKISEDPRHIEPYGAFFEKFGRSVVHRGKYVLRGVRYASPLNVTADEKQKFATFVNDFEEGVKILSTDEKGIERERLFLVKQAVYDCVKNSAVSLLNALIVDERDGNFRLDRNSKEDRMYQEKRKILDEVARASVFAQYAHLSGDTAVEQREVSILLSQLSKVQQAGDFITELSRNTDERSRRVRTSQRELTHPMSIAASALYYAELNHTYPPDVLIGLPTGSTEFIYAVQYAMEKFTGKRPKVILAPLSLHNAPKESTANNIERGLGDEELARFLKESSAQLTGKVVALVDDNASTGTTIAMLQNTVTHNFNPTFLEPIIAQTDIKRGTHIAKNAKPNIEGAHEVLSVVPYTMRSSVTNLPMSRMVKPGTPFSSHMFMRRMRDALEAYPTRDVAERIVKRIQLTTLSNPTFRVLREYFSRTNRSERTKERKKNRTAFEIRTLKQQSAELNLLKNIVVAKTREEIAILQEKLATVRLRRDELLRPYLNLKLEAKIIEFEKKSRVLTDTKEKEKLVLQIEALQVTLRKKIKHSKGLQTFLKRSNRGKRQQFITNLEHKYLSNFFWHSVPYAIPVEMATDGVGVLSRAKERVYPSTEHAYQAAKFYPRTLQGILSNDAKLSAVLKQVNERLARRPEYTTAPTTIPFVPVTREEFAEIFTSKKRHYGEIKNIADVLSSMGYERRDWTTIRLKVMTEVVLKKFEDPELQKKLLATGEDVIAEHNKHGDDFYGVIDTGEGVYGRNYLGLILMEVRNYYRNMPPAKNGAK